MPGKIEWIEFKGKDILYDDRSNLSPDEIINNANELAEVIRKSGKKNILLMVNITNTNLIPKVRDHLKRIGKQLDPFVAKGAVFGVTKTQKVLINLFNSITRMSVKVFNDPESAKEWLVE